MLDECMSMKGVTLKYYQCTRTKTCPVPISPTTNPTYTVRRLNMGLRDDRQVTNRLNSETDNHCDNNQQTHIMVFHRCGSLMSNQRYVTFTTSLLQHRRYLIDAGHN